MITTDTHSGFPSQVMSTDSHCNIPDRVTLLSPQIDDNGDIVPGQICEQLFHSSDHSIIGDTFDIRLSNGVNLPSPQLVVDDYIMPGQRCVLSPCAQFKDSSDRYTNNKSKSGIVEFEPLLNDDNTEVKVVCTEPTNEGLNVSDIVNDDVFLNVYTKLVSWFRDLPEGMFISRLLRENESDNELYQTRQLLFDALKAYDDFPFDLNSELKRRVGTRKIKLSLKLATDVHKLLSVLEGEDYNVIKELISNAKPKTQPQTQKCTNTQPVVTVAEFQMLKDTVITLQIDMLNLKQALDTSEKIRSEQIKTVQNSVDSIKGDIQRCAFSISESMSNANINFDALKATQSKVSKLEQFLDNAQLVRVDRIPGLSSSTISPPTGNQEASDIQLHSEHRSSDTTHSAADRGPLRKTRRVRRQVERSSHDVSDNRPRAASNTIPVVITNRRNDENCDYDSEGFHTATRHRTKRYFIGGYTNSLSIPELTSYINSCGPTVTNVRVFPLRKTRNKIIVRVNVEANNSADTILQPELWPRGVVCRPWLPRDARKKQQSGTFNEYNRLTHTRDYRNQSSEYNPNQQIAHRNRFSWLDYDCRDTEVD